MGWKLKEQIRIIKLDIANSNNAILSQLGTIQRKLDFLFKEIQKTTKKIETLKEPNLQHYKKQ